MSDAAVLTDASGAAIPDPDSSKTLGVSDGKLAMWIFLGSDGMSFMGLIAAYIALRFGNFSEWPNPTQHFAIMLTTLNTFILIVSSFSMVKAFVGAQTGDKAKLVRNLLITIGFGCVFLGIQAYEYSHQIHIGFTVGGFSPEYMAAWSEEHPDEAIGGSVKLFTSTFYVLTCFHGCHVLSGVIYLIIVLIGVLRDRWTVNRIEIVGLYWHFVDLVWIVIFTIVYLIE